MAFGRNYSAPRRHTDKIKIKGSMRCTRVLTCYHGVRLSLGGNRESIEFASFGNHMSTFVDSNEEYAGERNTDPRITQRTMSSEILDRMPSDSYDPSIMDNRT